MLNSLLLAIEVIALTIIAIKILPLIFKQSENRKYDIPPIPNTIRHYSSNLRLPAYIRRFRYGRRKLRAFFFNIRNRIKNIHRTSFRVRKISGNDFQKLYEKVDS